MSAQNHEKLTTHQSSIVCKMSALAEPPHSLSRTPFRYQQMSALDKPPHRGRLLWTAPN